MKSLRLVQIGFSATTLLLLAGCMSHGEHTSEGLSLAKTRLGQLKAGTELQMAEQQFMAGNLERAKKTAMKAITIEESNPKAFVLLGRIYLEEGKLEDAKGAFAKAESIDAKNVDAQYYTGIVYERFSQFDEAHVRYSRAAELSPDNPQYVVAAAEMLIRLRKLAEAERYLISHQDRFAHNAAIRQSLARLSALKGDHAKAVEYFSEARRLAPDDVLVMEELLRARIAVGDYREAEFDLAALLKNESLKGRRDLQLLRADCLLNTGRAGEARAMLTKLTSGDEGARDLAAWLLLGKACAELNDGPRMRIVAGRLIALAPERYEGYFLRALHLKQSGDAAGAMRSLDEAIAAAGEVSEPMLLKSLWLSDAGRPREALEVAQQVLAVQPDNANARQMVEALSGRTFTTAPEAPR